MKWFFYLTNENPENPNTLIKIKASRRPSDATKPRSGTWVVREFDGKNWLMPCFPEIIWATLKRFTYLGSGPIEDHMRGAP